MQDSLVLLANDPERNGVVQAVELDVHEIEILGEDCRTDTLFGVLRGTESHAKMYQAAHKMLGLLGRMDQYIGTVDLGDEQIGKFVAFLALATASYAGSHCHPLWGRLAEPEPELDDALMYTCHGFSLRSCYFACLDQYIGGPVWVFGAGTLQRGMLLSITTKHFDDLWGPVTELVEQYRNLYQSNTRTVALQTERGLLRKVESERSVPFARENEVSMHWTSAQQGSMTLHEVRSDSFFDLRATMLIGFGEQKKDSASHKKPEDISRCFDINYDCKLNAKTHQSSIEARSFEYIGTATRQWMVDTKALSIAAGWSGPSIGANPTWKLRPATSWKAAMLMYCTQPGRDIKPLMDLRVGLERSICTRNALRVSLLDALKISFPADQKTIMDLLDSAKTNELSRKLLMNYLNDLAQTGMDGRDCLKLFWPSLKQTIYRIDQNLPKWTRMLYDGQATCCFAVAIDDCLVCWSFNGHVRQNSKTSGRSRDPASPWQAQNNLLSTTINLQENPTAKLPLAPGGILKLNSGRLTISTDHLEGYAQSAIFWLPGALDKVTELRLGQRTHTELLDPNRSTGRLVEVCIEDQL